MSSTFKVYCNNVSGDLIPKIMEQLNKFDMTVSIHPNFKFDTDEDSGFLPFKFRLTNPYFIFLKDKDLISGFEIYIDEFNLTKETENLRPKLSFLNRLLGKKKQDFQYATPEIETKLKDLNIAVSLVWSYNNCFDFRFASLTSAILTQLTNGVCSHNDEVWFKNENIVENAYKDVLAFEQNFTKEDLTYTEFQKW